jgi:hypothetical protein
MPNVLAGTQQPRILSPATLFFRSVINLTIVLVFWSSVCKQTVGVGRGWPKQKDARLLQVLDIMDPVLSLAAPTWLSLEVTQSRYAKESSCFPIVLLAQRTSWKPLNIATRWGLADIALSSCGVLCFIWLGCEGGWLEGKLLGIEESVALGFGKGCGRIT